VSALRLNFSKVQQEVDNYDIVKIYERKEKIKEKIRKQMI
jgi:hypothetical protein